MGEDIKRLSAEASNLKTILLQNSNRSPGTAEEIRTILWAKSMPASGPKPPASGPH